ncbi:hypothetical protein BESB_015180 [Besnoitia besnoiti]|uniref:Uncharacterized protein n=1 Tax=Besnoitia besnoiti TaxID=94643 RepID=A0A2A9M4L1_BESBE|nr:hypothetical protein BESB_015180 [Besnoitia besnoiti]PFH32905.1 hypothetical protein BESB_015180 [Besnoitia besnoiti]
MLIRRPDLDGICLSRLFLGAAESRLGAAAVCTAEEAAGGVHRREGLQFAQDRRQEPRHGGESSVATVGGRKVAEQEVRCFSVCSLSEQFGFFPGLERKSTSSLLPDLLARICLRFAPLFSSLLFFLGCLPPGPSGLFSPLFPRVSRPVRRSSFRCFASSATPPAARAESSSGGELAELLRTAQELSFSRPSPFLASSSTFASPSSFRGSLRSASAWRSASSAPTSLSPPFNARLSPPASASAACSHAATWDEVLFQAHGNLARLSTAELLVLLDAMARFGPACLLSCARSRRRRREANAAPSPAGEGPVGREPSAALSRSQGVRAFTLEQQGFSVDFLEAVQAQAIGKVDELSLEEIAAFSNSFQLLQTGHERFLAAARQRLLAEQTVEEKEAETAEPTLAGGGLGNASSDGDSQAEAASEPWRLLRLWHAAGALGLAAPALAVAAVECFAGAAGAQRRVACSTEDLVFLVRGCAMHLARQSLLLPVSGGAADTPAASRPSLSCLGASASSLASAAAAGEGRREENATERSEEAAFDWNVGGLLLDALAQVEERVSSLDARYVILLFEALALVSYAPGSLVDKVLRTCALPRVPYMRPDEILGLLQTVAALDVQFDDLLQALGERVSQTLPQFELPAMIQLALHFSALDFPPNLLLSEVGARLDEALATCDEETLRQLQTLFERYGLPPERIVAHLDGQLAG